MRVHELGDVIAYTVDDGLVLDSRLLDLADCDTGWCDFTTGSGHGVGEVCV